MKQEKFLYYLGYGRGYVGNPAGFLRDTVVNFRDPGHDYKINVSYLNGSWYIGRDYIEPTSGTENYILILFNGLEMDIILDKGSKKGEIKIKINDIETAIKVSSPGDFNVIKKDKADNFLLKIIPYAGLRVSALRFS